MDAMNQGGTEPTNGRGACKSASLPYGVDEALKDRPEAKPKTGRDACESALRALGLDEVLIAKKLKNQLEAKDRRWNPKTKCWDVFDDYDKQLAAAREIGKILGVYPSPESLRNRDKDAKCKVIVMNLPPRERPDDPPK